MRRILSQSCTPDASEACPNLGPSCNSSKDCNDGLACTIDNCIIFTPPGTKHCDWSQNLTCNDSSVCTADHCDQLKGCVFDEVLFCDDSNNCTIDSCDPIKGCVHTAVKCKDLNVCNLASCNSITGCGLVQRNCTGNLSKILDNCTVAYCDVNYTQKGLKNPCQPKNVCSSAFPIAVGLAAGIIALIVVLAILGFLLFSGGVAAAASTTVGAREQAVNLNPLYEQSGLSGVNAVN